MTSSLITSELDRSGQLDEGHVVAQETRAPVRVDRVLGGSHFNAIRLVVGRQADVVSAEQDVEERGIVSAVYSI